MRLDMTLRHFMCVTALLLCSSSALGQDWIDQTGRQLAEQKASALNNAGDDAVARAAIERRFAKSKLQLDKVAKRTKPKKGDIFLEDLPRIKRGGNRNEFDWSWTKFATEAKSVVQMQGRVICTNFAIEDWEKVATARYSDVKARPASSWVIDFATDYLELKTRQDWLTTLRPDENVDLVSHFDLLKLPLFESKNSELTNRTWRFAETPDYSLRRVGSSLGELGMPDRTGVQWPGVLDFRVIGWFSRRQWIDPTTQEGWWNVFNHCDPYSFGRADDEGADRLVFYWPTNTSPRIIDLHLNRTSHGEVVPTRFAYWKVLLENENELFTREHPEFESKFFREEKKVLAIVTRERGAQEFWRYDLLQEPHVEIDDKWFTERDFVDSQGKILVTPEYKAFQEAMTTANANNP